MASQCIDCADRPARRPGRPYGNRCSRCQRRALARSFCIDPDAPTPADLSRLAGEVA